MISQHAFGKENEIETLLSKSMLNMDKAQIKAWMKYEFDPSSMFIHIDDGIVTSCLQTKRKTFFYKGQKCSISVYTMTCTLPDYRQRGYFSELLEAALEQSGNNDLLSMVNTSFPKLFESRSFTPVSKAVTYSLTSNKCTEGNERNIKTYSDTDLYPVYTIFMSHFDGNIVYSKEEFDNQIRYALASNKKIVLMMDEEKIKGFAIYKINKNYAKIDTMIYLNGSCIYDLFKFLSLRCQTITFSVSEFERIEKLFPLEYPRNSATIIARCNNYKLFSKWCNQDVHNAKQIFEQLDKPNWNLWIE